MLLPDNAHAPMQQKRVKSGPTSVKNVLAGLWTTQPRKILNNSLIIITLLTSIFPPAGFVLVGFKKIIIIKGQSPVTLGGIFANTRYLEEGKVVYRGPT